MTVGDLKQALDRVDDQEEVEFTFGEIRCDARITSLGDGWLIISMYKQEA